MKVFNMFEEEVKEVAAQFEYKGFTISASNIMRKPFMEIVCWDNESPANIYSGFATVEDAITFINCEVK
ncbi:hypothetical protein VPHF99_0140 [Vibrio phage F99]|nr:hypothetical protein MYOV085v1_p0010 [Vibrio phage 355E48.1]